MSTFDLTGRRALVTGGARGLGAGMAQALTAAGARVMIADVLKDVGEQTAAGLDGGGFVQLDVTSDGEWEAAVARKNVSALAFWRKTISRHKRVTDLEEIDMRGDTWNGPVLCFRISRGA